MKKTNKIIADYNAKIATLDKKIEAEKNHRNNLRKSEPANHTNNLDYLEAGFNLQKFNACRQIYIQAISDIEDLTD